MPHKAFLHKKSLLDQFKDDHKHTGVIQSMRAEHTWNNPLTRRKRTKKLNGWIKSFDGKNHIRKLSRFNAVQAHRHESLDDTINFKGESAMQNEAMSLKGFIENLSDKLVNKYGLEKDVVKNYLDLHTEEMQELLDDKELSLKEKVLFVRSEITGEKDEKKSEFYMDDDDSEDYYYCHRCGRVTPSYELDAHDGFCSDCDAQWSAEHENESKKHEGFNTTRDLDNFALHILNYIKDKTHYPGYVRFVKLNDNEEDFYGKYVLSVNGKNYYLYVGDTDYSITDNNDENTIVEGSTDLSGAMNKDLDDFCERIQQPFYTESKKPTDEKLGYEKGHKNSKGEDAPWVIRSHEDNRVLASFAKKKDAEEHLKRMKQYSKSESYELASKEIQVRKPNGTWQRWSVTWPEYVDTHIQDAKDRGWTEIRVVDIKRNENTDEPKKSEGLSNEKVKDAVKFAATEAGLEDYLKVDSDGAMSVTVSLPINSDDLKTVRWVIDSNDGTIMEYLDTEKNLVRDFTDDESLVSMLTLLFQTSRMELRDWFPKKSESYEVASVPFATGQSIEGLVKFWLTDDNNNSISGVHDSDCAQLRADIRDIIGNRGFVCNIEPVDVGRNYYNVRDAVKEAARTALQLEGKGDLTNKSEALFNKEELEKPVKSYISDVLADLVVSFHWGEDGAERLVDKYNDVIMTNYMDGDLSAYETAKYINGKENNNPVEAKKKQESKKNEMHLEFVDTIVVPKWLWDAHLFGKDYTETLTDEEEEIRASFEEEYGKKYYLDDEGNESYFSSHNDFDEYGGPCYEIKVYREK